jgi:enoyl-CoA hydratase/carnithine racemase
MEAPSVRCEVTEGIATVTLDRPDALNAFTDTMEAELVEAFRMCDADDNVRVVVLTGAGRAFCAGMDLTGNPETTFADWRTSPNAPEEARYGVDASGMPLRRDGGGRVVLEIFASRKPVIAAINGAAVGVGVTMTLAADIRIASDRAKLGFVFNRRGLVPEACSSWFLPRVVPMSTALEWVLTGRTLTAVDAAKHGLVRSVHPSEDLLPVAYRIAREIADNTAPVSAAIARQMMWRMLGADHPMEAHRLETHALNTRGISADAIEGIVSFLEKREADFPGRVSTDYLDLFIGAPTPQFRPFGDAT